MFLVNLKIISYFWRIFNSHGNTDFIMRILFDYQYKYLGAFRFVLVSRNNGTIKSLFVCPKANYESGLRAAARYHENEGVSVK